ncbi:uncharacterized protein LOC124690448 [Lolium rigidum]|uniref:uncharacterized protein LOC124690448 n=1 Tax=Lolium rigidum TaxID=89674 RepID=UPI001F5D30CD|nr:uncharacterized protein LOC124690448 [Lolium rigidum]
MYELRTQHYLDFDDAVKKLAGLLRESYGTAEGKTKLLVLYHSYARFSRTSVVLGAIAKLLKSTVCDVSDTTKHFSRIVYVDRSLCRNTRTMQRAIAEELNLGHVMNLFDKQDEDDDFRGVDDSLRKEISSVGSLINESLRNERFLVIFYYGEVEEMDLVNCGIPLFGKGVLLCSPGGLFQVEQRDYKMSIFHMIYIFMGSNPSTDTGTQTHHILLKEAAEVIRDTVVDGINPEIVLDCFLYSLFLTTQLLNSSIGVEYDWATHACNYWICDGIVGGERTWEIGNALYGVIPQLSNSTDRTRLLASYLNGRKNSYKGWYSVTSNKCGGDHIPNVPHNASSYFLTFEGDDPVYVYYVLLPLMVELMTNLRELNTKGVSWKTMSHVWKKLEKLYKLRVTKSSDVFTVDSCSSIDMMNLELLDLSSNTNMEFLPTLSSARSLKMLVLDGCSSLENVVLEGAPPLLESFSFDGYGPAENWNHSIQLPKKELRLQSPIAPIETVQVTKISLHGCGRLQNIFLRALPNLEDLDLSGTAIKTKELDLLAMDIPKLKKLFLLGCQHLRSLIWRALPKLEVLRIDMQWKQRSMVYCGIERSFSFHAFIAFTDGRFTFRFIEGLYHRISQCLSMVYLLISCMSHSQANNTKSIKEIGPSQEGLVPTSLILPYDNVALTKDVMCSSFLWNHQQLQTLDVHIEIGEGSYNIESMHDNSNFNLFARHVQSLHVHDNSSITAIPPANETNWDMLEWCHVVRCPKLQYVFFRRYGRESFGHIRIISASDLLVAYCIWSRGTIIQNSCFARLQHIYMYNCPRLVYVLPISFSLPNLETLQIAYCSNLRDVFPLDDKYPPAISSGVTFKNLKQIKLYHLHNLGQICEVRLTAPALQTIGLRDCWGLRRLPAVAREGPKPVVDCEKDWWNKLEWDGLDAGHDPSLFETRHSAYYRKTLPMVSFLR